MPKSNVEFIERWFEELWNNGREGAIDEWFAEQGVAHGLGDEPIRGPDEFKMFYRAFRSAFRDIQVTIQDTFASGDRIAFRCTVDAIHCGTGKPIVLRGGGMCRLRAGQIVEAWNMWDFLDVLIQLGSVEADAFARAMVPAGAGR